jgi:N-dimethylarginine dimethylaminohydrolase
MQKRILMARAEHFGVEFEINPWMDKEHQPSQEKALEQQDKIIDTLEGLGHKLEFINPSPECPDLCFTANAGVVRGNKVLLSHLPEARRPELPLHKQWFEEHGFETHQTSYRFGGGGDALWIGDTLVAGYADQSRRASDIEVHDELRQLFGTEVISLHTTDPRFYDLDMALGVLSPQLIAYCPDVFDNESIQKLKTLTDIELLEVSLPDALGFGCNLQSDGANVIISNRAPGLIKDLRGKDFNVLPHSIGQYMLSGGGIRCLGLDLPYEDPR